MCSVRIFQLSLEIFVNEFENHNKIYGLKQKDDEETTSTRKKDCNEKDEKRSKFGCVICSLLKISLAQQYVSNSVARVAVLWKRKRERENGEKKKKQRQQ